jgi:hypothetical protein
MARIERHEPTRYVKPPDHTPAKNKAMGGVPESVIKVAEEVSPVGEARIKSLGKSLAKRPEQGFAQKHDISYPSTVK